MRAGPVRAVASVLLALYAVVVARLTLLPANSETTTFGVLNRVLTRLSRGGLSWTQIEALANVALFVPAGFLLAIVLRRAWAGALACALASGAIEWAQYAFLPSRVPSLADVEHNSLGGLIGALVAWPLARLLRATPVSGSRPAMPVSASGRAR